MADDSTTPSVPTIPLPPEPDPAPLTPPKTEPPVPPMPPSPEPALDPIPAPTPTPAPAATPQTESVVESILQHHSAGPKKPSKGPLIALIALLLLVLPVSVYFISQQNQQLADIRSKATLFTYSGCKTGPGFECCKNDPNACPGQGGPNACHCQGGDLCNATKCEDLEQACRNDGRQWCDNYQGFGKTCCVRGYVCASVGNGCVPGGGGGGDDDNGDDDDTTATPTPTTGITPVCQNIKLYKDGVQVTDLTTLRPGDEVVLAVKGNLNPTKAHFRVNGGAWNETTTKNGSNEFTWGYTIIDGVTDFVIEGEVFTNGAWH
ncbi:hypothetical protein HZB58_01800 [Candidatus Gottesmanbacteria bacterium]|nr:hypothetical protein [Candidatus Gottesmanbacteria bacterium]